MATTTSTYDSGLLGAILPEFERAHDVKVKVIAVGTGQAIELGERGDADIILVHSRSREDKFVAEGYGVSRRDVMYNDFVLIGSRGDPAQIRGLSDAAAAFREIAGAQVPFISRGDNSGTHSKERAIWKKAELEPGGNWYVSAGQGMGAVLTMAEEQQAYTLTDRGTYLVRREGLSLPILVEGDEMLFNPYGIIPVNPERHPRVNYELAEELAEWMTSVETQGKIGEYKRFEEVLFHPNSEMWHRSR